MFFGVEMHFPGTESRLVHSVIIFGQSTCKTELLQKKEEPSPPGMCGRGKKSRKKIWKLWRAIEMLYGIVCIAMGICRAFLSFISERLSSGQLNYQRTLQKEGIGSHCHELSAETFFPPFRSKSRITHNANNSEATEQVRNLLGFTGFLVVQTFNSQAWKVLLH